MRARRALAAGLALVGLASLAAGVWMPAKAVLAQVLLRRAWARTEGPPVRPWPWAHTWPVARLRVPRLGVDEIVLAGAEGAALAFAPGHVDGTTPPGVTGNVVLAGHRDTVFRFLTQLELGDEVWLESADRQRRRFVVRGTAVVHELDTAVMGPTSESTLTLITCYPLDAVRPGGPLRYVARALEGPDRSPGDRRQAVASTPAGSM